MQFNNDIRIMGDLRVKAMGTEALMQKEVRSQRLQGFLQLGSNPMLAPWINVGPVLKEYAYSIDIDPEEAVNDLDQAKVMASLIEQAGAMGLGGSPGASGPLGLGSAMGANSGIPGGSTGTGDGTIAPANVQMPADPGFSGGPPGGAGAGKPPE